MGDNSTAFSPSNLTSPSSTDLFRMSGGWLFYMVAALIDHTLGIPANVWSLHVIVTSGGRRWSLVESEIITLNVVAIEIGSSLHFILVLINYFFIQCMSMGKWLTFIFALAISGRALFQTLVCVERYLAVVHPVVFLRYKPLRYKLACCGLVWLIAVGYTGLFGFLALDFFILSIMLVVLFIILLSIDLFCSLSILRALRQPGPGDRGRERGRGGRERVREKKDGGKEEDSEKKDEGKENREKRGGEEEQTATGGERGKGNEGERVVERGKENMKEEGKNQQKRRAFRIVSFMIGMLVFNSVPLIMCAPLHSVFGNPVFLVEVFPVLVSLSQMGSCVQALLHLHRAGRLPCLTTTTSAHQQNN